ncbi:MAG: hypothetical protein AAF690_18050 [Acidobacteriota bacterium]
MILRTEELFRAEPDRRDLLSEGLAAANEALSLNATHGRALAVRGALRMLVGQADQAKTDLQKALELNRHLTMRFEPWLDRAAG